MAGFLVISPIMFLGCGSSHSTAPDPQASGDEFWFAGIDASAVWVDISDNCIIRVEADKAKADSVCKARGYTKASGYDPLDCWVGGIKDTYMECVACSYNN